MFICRYEYLQISGTQHLLQQFIELLRSSVHLHANLEINIPLIVYVMSYTILHCSKTYRYCNLKFPLKVDLEYITEVNIKFYLKCLTFSFSYQ